MLMQLFPHFLMRVGGQPFERLESLNLTKPFQVIERINVHKREIGILREKMCDELYLIIKALKDPHDRVKLLNIKRDIFNGRSLLSEEVEVLKRYFTAEMFTCFREYQSASEEVSSLIAQGEQLFSAEMSFIRNNLRHLATNAELQKGLLLSSHSLLKRINGEYLNKDLKDFHKSDYDTERSLVKYLSRMCAKTSPFSTFTNLAKGTLHGGNGSKGEGGRAVAGVSLRSNQRTTTVSHIRLNNHLYRFLLNLLTENSAIYSSFLLKLNPTLTREEEQYCFLVNSDNVESFQYLPANPALEVCRNLVAAESEGLSYRGLVQKIVEGEYFDAETEEIASLIERLIDFGFLEFNIGVSGNDPDWDMRLREKLEEIADGVPLLTPLIQTLEHIRDLAHRYATADPTSRKEILEDAYARFRSICMSLHEAAGLPQEEREPPEGRRSSAPAATEPPASSSNAIEDAEDKDGVFTRRRDTRFNFRPEQIFYEDTSIDISPEFDEEKTRELVSAVHCLLKELSFFEIARDERERMRYYFSGKYGPANAVPLLTFYEDYYREIKRPEEERIDALQKERRTKLRQEASPDHQGQFIAKESDIFAEARQEIADSILLVPEIEERRHLRSAWSERLAALIEAQGTAPGEEVRITLEHIRAINRTLSIDVPGGHPTSYGMFIQFFDEQGQPDGRDGLKGVLNGPTPGFGKMISRFLHIFEPEMTDAQREWNLATEQNSILAEACDTSFFNANLHPPLMPFEVAIPDSNNSLPVTQQIPVTDLAVSFDESSRSLRLIHTPSGRFVYVFDLGLQNIMGRSPLYQLLCQFTLANTPSGLPLREAINGIYERKDRLAGEGEISVRPRIMFEDCVVLQRRAWIVPKRLLPLRRQQEGDWAYFIRLNEWRLERGIPEEVFVFILPQTTPELIPAEGAKRLGRDDYKPQYVSFRNPLLVKLLEGLMSKAPESCKIEEMLPRSDQLLGTKEGRRVTEFLIQTYG